MANLLTGNNASFSTTIGTWDETTNAGNFTTTWNSADGGVLKAEVTTGGANIAVASHPSGDATKIPITAGTTITCEASSKQLSGTARAWRVEAAFYNAAATNFSNLTAATGTLTVGSYVTLSGVVTVPATAVRMRLRVRWDTPAIGEIFYLDNPVVDDASGAINLGNTKTSVLTGAGWALVREDRIT